MAKSLAGKTKTEKGGKSSAYPPTITQEIIPGKFNNHDWNLIVEQDSNDEFCGEIVDEIFQAADNLIFESYLKKQLIPFTVNQAKDALTQIVQWRFLSRDEGEDETDIGWVEDIEPDTCVTDSWAQGLVPKQTLVSPRALTPCDPIKEDENPEEVHGEKEISESLLSNEINEDDIAENTEQHSPITPPVLKKTVNSKKKSRSSFLKDQSTPTYSESQRPQPTLEQEEDVDLAMLQMPLSCQSILKLQAGRPPGHRDIYYDEAGNVVSMTKIHADKLPTHRVQPVFRVVDPAVEAAQSQLEAMRTGRYRRSNKTIKPVLSQSECLSQRSTGRSQGTKVYNDPDRAAVPLPPPLLESMTVAAGVVVKEGTRIKQGPKLKSKRTGLISTATRRGLMPLTIRANIDEATVSQLLQHHNPVIRPLTDSPPVPPILPHPPTYAKSSTSSVSAH